MCVGLTVAWIQAWPGRASVKTPGSPRLRSLGESDPLIYGVVTSTMMVFCCSTPSGGGTAPPSAWWFYPTGGIAGWAGVVDVGDADRLHSTGGQGRPRAGGRLMFILPAALHAAASREGRTCPGPSKVLANAVGDW